MFDSDITWYGPLLYAGAIVWLVLYDLRGGVTAPNARVSLEGIFCIGHSVSRWDLKSILTGFIL